MNARLRRILTDGAGYLLIVAGIALSPIPGPGGVPLILGGLGLLSIDNPWARRWREWLAHNTGGLLKWFFPKHKFVENLYDLVAVLLIGLIGYLIWKHSAIWQISVAATLFFVAMTIIGMNRDRAGSLKAHLRGDKS